MHQSRITGQQGSGSTRSARSSPVMHQSRITKRT